ncbi:MAG: ribose-5-phosphate isomerase RpiA [Sphaerobacter thermophilus]|uniref:Ribose-5-phosphate isomerase A n=1 Tax=Sphaerobacter thermophilus (strain ATCC 49802 / DSM 20745 / KCCM 41009 / NCIMB 13125 / S 6022) TaxID=479434 RepID=D1C4M5_SPHTD|nr:ribose-5-phosphate isomerase RpiA [Sphaerobacter thermophilus]ACZ39192.1 ribose 5-phosphate isomerase [Sphaerobacter thermophilus DSM 20745]PZN66835.1 MAG: ribose-5-phosphate isomerase RpiA [Sphaerobacter thermophilus]
MPPEGDEQTRRKRAAAERAASAVQDGAVVGLGTGSTAECVIQALAERVKEGLRIVGVPTSLRSERLARSLGIPLIDLQDATRIDVTIDGADEVAVGTLDVLKGHGGALLREKLVAVASEREVIVVDDTKLVERLGSRFAVPVEVVPFGWRVPAQALEALGGRVALRSVPPEGEPFVTDNGNYILDVDFGPIANPAALANEIKTITGVIEHGLFIGIAHEVIVAGAQGVEVLTRG